LNREKDSERKTRPFFPPKSQKTSGCLGPGKGKEREPHEPLAGKVPAAQQAPTRGGEGETGGYGKEEESSIKGEFMARSGSSSITKKKEKGFCTTPRKSGNFACFKKGSRPSVLSGKI